MGRNTVKKVDTEVKLEQELPLSPKKRSNKYSVSKGHNYERQIVKELKELSNDLDITTSRNESKALDNAKIDIFDPNDTFPCYFQLKKTKSTPSVKKINNEVGRIDKPLVILWNIQETKEGNVNITSAGEYAIIPKTLFYELLELKINKKDAQ